MNCATCQDKRCFKQVLKERSTVIWCSAYKEKTSVQGK